MIQVTRLNNKKMTINADLIEMVEETPDTVISFTNGKKFIVKESEAQVRELVIAHKKEVFADLCQIIAKSVQI